MHLCSIINDLYVFLTAFMVRTHWPSLVSACIDDAHAHTKWVVRFFVYFWDEQANRIWNRIEFRISLVIRTKIVIIGVYASVLFPATLGHGRCVCAFWRVDAGSTMQMPCKFIPFYSRSHTGTDTQIRRAFLRSPHARIPPGRLAFYAERWASWKETPIAQLQSKPMPLLCWRVFFFISSSHWICSKWILRFTIFKLLRAEISYTRLLGMALNTTLREAIYDIINFQAGITIHFCTSIEFETHLDYHNKIDETANGENYFYRRSSLCTNRIFWMNHKIPIHFSCSLSKYDRRHKKLQISLIVFGHVPRGKPQIKIENNFIFALKFWIFYFSSVKFVNNFRKCG